MIRAHTSPYSFFILSFKRGKLGVGDELKLLVLNNPWEKVLSCNNPIKACKCSYPFVFLPLLCLSCLFPKKIMRFINPFPVGLTFLIHPSTPFIGRGLGNDPFYPSGQIWLSSIFAMNKGHEGRREEGEALSKSLWFHVFLSNYRSFLQLVSFQPPKLLQKNDSHSRTVSWLTWITVVKKDNREEGAAHILLNTPPFLQLLLVKGHLPTPVMPANELKTKTVFSDNGIADNGLWTWNGSSQLLSCLHQGFLKNLN